ncbi:MAG TPA: DsrE family protein [Acidimicrobiia bacterium]|nr:DsrE family protein [Acidimicrobiia bacterium]
MGSLLVHLTHGPEAPTISALACLVALAAVDEGHEVTMFFAGDAVHLMKDSVIESTAGIGTGALADHIPNLVAKGVPIYVSKMSAAAREVTEADIATKNATFAAPAKLIELTFAADRVITY